MSYANFLANERVVYGDGQGRIFTADAGGGNVVQFPYGGFDPIWAWGGAAILWVDPSRQWLWCANVDGSGLYSLNVTTTDRFTCPVLHQASGLYYVNTWDPSLGTYKLWRFGGGGYNITLLATWVDWGFTVHPNGETIVVSGISAGRFQLFNMPTDLSYQGSFISRDDTASAPDARHPAYDANGAYLTYQTGDLVGVNPQVPSSYKTNDIGVIATPPMYNWNGHVVMDANAVTHPDKLGVGGATGTGIFVDSPNWSAVDGSGVVTYDFNAPAGSGIWAFEAFNKSSATGGGVFGNPNGPGWQFGTVGQGRCKHK